MGLKELFIRPFATYLECISKNDPSITGADLVLRGIGDDDAEQLADALEGNTALTWLNLEANKIGDRGATKLAERLKMNETLEELYLSYNKVADGGASDLAEMLQVNKSLKTLWLYRNNITNAGAIKLAEMLQVNKSLKKLWLHQNNITNVGAIKLAEALQWSNSTITDLNLWGNSGISKDVMKKIERLAKINEESPSPEVALQRKIEEFGPPPPQPHPHPGPSPAQLPNPNPEPIPNKSRYIAFDEPDDDALGPIRGVFDNERNPVVSIADAVASLPLELESELFVANEFVKKPATIEKMKEYSGLTPCMVAAIFLYTMESDLYKDLNKLLRGSDRKKLRGTPGNSFFPYVRLLFSAVRVMSSSQPRMINRGVPRNLVTRNRDKYLQGGTLMWWSFSSCTSNIEVLKNPDFLGTHGERTIFQIHTSKSVNVKHFSAIPSEAEQLLPAGCAFKITGLLNMADGLTIVTLEEYGPPLIS